MEPATFNIQVLPRRLMTKAEATHYCGRSLKRFIAACPVKPIQMADGALLWDVRDLDDWINSLKAERDSDVNALLARLG